MSKESNIYGRLKESTYAHMQPLEQRQQKTSQRTQSIPPFRLLQPMWVVAILHSAIGVMDGLQQADDVRPLHTLDAGNVPVAKHQTLIAITTDVAVNHVAAFPLVERTAEFG